MALSKKPLSRAEKEETIPSLQCSNCIAAIDFGTSSISLAYTTPLNKGDIQVVKFDEKFDRIPNAILIHVDNNKKCEVESIGHCAQETFGKINQEDMKHYLYFERMKILLERDKDIHRKFKVKSFTGGEFYLLEVIAFIIKYLKEILLEELKSLFNATDFDWVITIPAIWKSKARGMMREAAYLAGLTYEYDGIETFTDTTLSSQLPDPKKDQEVNPHKLSLALEPEVAAIYAYLQPKLTGPLVNERYMVVDIGGGTVDIAVHSRRDGKIDILLPPDGNMSGGSQLNKALSQVIADLLEDKNHQEFLKSDGAAIADINSLYYTSFEQEKKKFGKSHGKEGKMKIKLPSPFVKFYTQEVISKKAQQAGMTYETRNEVLCIDYDLLEETVFNKTITSILDCVKKILRQLDEKLDTIYLVGGFGGSRIIKENFKKEIEGYINAGRIEYPPNPELAVIKGAVMCRRSPDLIQSRIADATYGICICPQFNPSIHDEHYHFFDEDNLKRCNNVFCVFVLKGETIERKLYKTQLVPALKNNTQMSISIYCTKDDDVQYTKNKQGHMIVQHIGNVLTINIPNPDNVPKRERKVDIFFDFIGTEIQATATYHLDDKEKVKTVCDFLSYQEEQHTSAV